MGIVVGVMTVEGYKAFQKYGNIKMNEVKTLLQFLQLVYNITFKYQLKKKNVVS